MQRRCGWTPPHSRLSARVARLLACSLGLCRRSRWAVSRSIRCSPTAAASAQADAATRLFGRGLVVTQVALSVVLLIGATLLLTSFRHLLRVDAGFTAARVTTATIFPPPSRYPDAPAVVTLVDRFLEAVRAIPGVEAAGHHVERRVERLRKSGDGCR